MKNKIYEKAKNQHGTLSKHYRGFAVGMLVLVVVIILYASFVIMDMMERRAHSAAEKLVSEVVEHINNKMTEVENVTRDAAVIAYGEIDNPEGLERLVRNFVESNDFVYGSTVAFEPDAFPQYGRCFAPYSWVTSDGMVHSRQLGTETDYYEEEWYAQTKLKGEEYWCEPYFDEGGAKIMMCTFSVPLKDENGELAAVMTADVGLEDLKEYVSTINPDQNSYIVLRSRNGNPLANAELDSIASGNNIIIKGIAEVGWSVELIMPFSSLVRGDIGILVFTGIIFLSIVLFVFFINQVLNRLARRSSEEYMNVIGALSEKYIAVDYVVLKSGRSHDVLKEFRVSRRLDNLIPDWGNTSKIGEKLDLLIDQLVYEPDRNQFSADVKREKILRELNMSDTYFVNTRFLIANEIRYYQIQISAVREKDKLTGFVMGLHSIDEQMRKEKDQQRKLEDALMMAESANMAKTTFLNNMSHDIRTPINAITGFTVMAQKYVDDKERVTDYLKKIDVSGQQLLMLVNQVLEMSRIESGKIEFDEHPVNVKERFDIMVTVLSEQASIKGLTLTHTLSDARHLHVFADDTRMSQITLNLVGNAIKYTPEGGRVDFSLHEIPARKEGYATYVFTVADTGIGMSKEYLEHLFEPFTRENNSTVSKIQGTGLGMSIVKSLIDLAGGKIEVQSELGKGTRFDVTLDFRINEVEPTVSGEQSTEDLGAEIINLKGKKILLVEDNELNREIGRFLLEDLGIEVYEATDGTYAVEEIKAIIDRGEPNFYDLILMDIQMPMLDGYEATRQIRDLGCHIPIIAVSANAFEEDKQKSIEAGMDGHIAKPIDIPELMSTIAKFI